MSVPCGHLGKMGPREGTGVSLMIDRGTYDIRMTAAIASRAQAVGVRVALAAIRRAKRKTREEKKKSRKRLPRHRPQTTRWTRPRATVKVCEACCLDIPKKQNTDETTSSVGVGAQIYGLGSR